MNWKSDIKFTCRKPLKAFLASAALVAAPLAATAQMTTSAYDFLNIPTSSHSFAMGGAGIAIVDDDLTLIDQNPALLGPEIEKQIAVGYMHWLGTSNFASARYGQAAGERGAWSVGIRYLNYGTMTQAEADGTLGGTFAPQDMIIGGTYSHDFNDKLRGGITLNMVYSNYEQYTAFALSTDLGLNYYNDENDLSLSVVFRNMGGQLKRFNNAYDRLPFDIQVGYMQGLGTSPFSLSITARHLTRWRLEHYFHNSMDSSSVYKSNFFSNLFRHLVFGLQYSPSERFYIAAGYDYKMRSDMSNYQRNFISGFSLGLGLRVKGFSFGASYAMPHKAGSSIMLNIGCSIAELMH